MDPLKLNGNFHETRFVNFNNIERRMEKQSEITLFPLIITETNDQVQIGNFPMIRVENILYRSFFFTKS